MKIGILGLCHLGSVTAAAMADLGHRVLGVDADQTTVDGLQQGVAPVSEPGLQEMLERGRASGNLRFSSSLDELKDCDVLWVTYDTPVGEDDQADPDFVMARIEVAMRAVGPAVLLLISSQLPVGSVRRLERHAADLRPGVRPRIAYSPENLRLGSAVADFMRPARIVVGVRSEEDRELLRGLLSTVSESIEWMSVESAEMTKHAVNAFFATSVVFANEIASLCESVGADAKDVERGLKTEPRIGAGAYLAPGAAFAGGSLARDVAFLAHTARDRGVVTPLLASVLPSNDRHRQWAQRTLQDICVDLSRTTIAVWGLTYKPNTDSLRRSWSIELCNWLVGMGARARVHDPIAKCLPDHWGGAVQRLEDPIDAVQGAQALVIATEWPIYRSISADQLIQCTDRLAVLDANRFVPGLAEARGHLRYFAVGTPAKES
jgi:UDPglucose 6-dehydrogenase